VLGGLVVLGVALLGDAEGGVRLLLAGYALLSGASGAVTLRVSALGTRWAALGPGGKLLVLPGVVLGWPGLLLVAGAAVVLLHGADPPARLRRPRGPSAD
jgi:hypothetical protein